MKIRRFSALVAGVAAGALVLSACSTPGDDGGAAGGGGGDAGIDEGTAITIAWNQPFYEYNDDSATGNATANANVLYLMNAGFNYYDGDLNLVQDTSFGSYEKTADDPLTIAYTFTDDVAWSDGTSVDAADLLLYWGALSGNFNTVEEVTDEDTGEVTNQDEIDSGVYFNFTSDSVGLIEDFPEVSDDGKTITFVYTVPFADWERNLAMGVPAHVVAMHALGLDDPQEAKDALIAAFQDNDTEALLKISQFWNTGFQFGNALPDDESLYLSSGAYLLTEYVEGQYVTLTANPDYTGDQAPTVERVTIRYNEDPMAQVQALENGDVDVISPQSTADVLAALQNLGDGYEIITQSEGTYEHVDLQFANGGPFDPATYGGDAATALAVRQAFLKLIPRQEIVDKLVVPLNPDAEIRNSFTAVPGSPNYDVVTAANGMSAYDTVDLDGATALLVQAGVQTPIDVRFLFATSNVRRQQEFQLIAASVSQDGLFNLVDASSEEWGTLLSDPTVYDASLFGWQSTSTAVTESDANYRTGGGNNFGGYSNEEVDALFDELQVETDVAAQGEILAQIEKFLTDDAFGVTLWQFPGVTAFNTNVTGIDPITISPTVFWNFWKWETAGDTAGEPEATEPAEEETTEG